MSNPSGDFFTPEMAQRYDERNHKLLPILDCLHFLMGLVLKNLSEHSHVLSVGAGTGKEIISLSQIFPHWTFVALEPSASMLQVCREQLQAKGLADRCDFVQGYIQDLPQQPTFDAVLSILVGHFVNRDERLNFFKTMSSRLRSGGYLVNAEISFDLDSLEFPSMLKNWESIQALMGATPASLAALPKQLREVLTVLPPSETERLFRQSGISCPIRFFQSFMVCGWFGIKDETYKS